MKKKFNKKCKICGKDFISKNVRKVFCSNACRVKSSANNNRKEYKKICEQCGKEFVSPLSGTRFCSPNCVATMKNNKGIGKVHKCKKCSKEFSQKHKRHFFCSLKCKAEYTKARLPLVIVICSNCSSEIQRPKHFAKRKQNFFCSRKCEGDFRHKSSEDIRECELCKNTFSCNKSEKLRFCSMECQSQWQRETGFGKNHPSYNHEITDEMRIKLCESCGKEMSGTPKEFETKKYCSYACKTKMTPRTLSLPHKKVLDILDKLNIKYEVEAPLARYSIDCKIKNSNLCIEVMGEFWHCDNRKYKNPICLIQEKSIKRDRRKKEEIYKQSNLVLYIWEKDINEKESLCEKLILEFFEKNGKIKNCHSMNYFLKKEKLKLSNKILIPFFER